MSEWKETDFGMIPATWGVSTLGSISEMLTDGSHLSPRLTKSGYYYMASVKDMRYNRFDFSTCKTISKEDFDFLVRNNCSPNYGDILLSKDGANCLDIIFVYKQTEKIVLLSSIAIARLKKGFDPDFYRYFLLSPNTQQMMRNNFVSGSAIPRVILKDFRNVPVPIIDYSEQLRIARTLNDFDTKIDLLTCQNETIEQLAETLFRQWFIEEAEQDWQEKSLIDIANYLNGLALQKYPALGIDSLPVIKIRELKQGITDTTDKCSSDIPQRYVVNDGDILFSWSGSLDVVIWHDGKGALNQHLFKVTSNNYPKWFYYFATKHHLSDFRMIAESKSTTMGHIQREHLQEAKILIPPETLFKEYDQIISPLVEKIITNNSQIKTLIKQRDTLLPKLMSGEATIKE